MCAQCGRVGALSPRLQPTRSAHSGELYVNRLHLRQTRAPEAPQHAGPVQRPVPRPLYHRLRILPVHGEFYYFRFRHLFRMTARSRLL